MIFKIYSAVIVLLFSSSHLCTALSFSPGPLIPFSALSEVHIHCSDGFFRLWIRSLSVTLIYKKKETEKTHKLFIGSDEIRCPQTTVMMKS